MAFTLNLHSNPVFVKHFGLHVCIKAAIQIKLLLLLLQQHKSEPVLSTISRLIIWSKQMFLGRKSIPPLISQLLWGNLIKDKRCDRKL